MIVRSEFHPPDFAAPVDAAAQKRLVPPGGTVKGMQLQAVVDECTRRGHSVEKRFAGFRDYSGEVQIDLLIESATLCHPRVPVREGMRRLGHIAYPTLAKSMIGRVVFGLVGSDPRSLISLVSKATRSRTLRARRASSRSTITPPSFAFKASTASSMPGMSASSSEGSAR